MPEWLFTASEISLASAMVVFGLVLFLSPHRTYTKMTKAVVPAVWFMAGLSLFHSYAGLKLPGWPLLVMGLVWWLLSYAAFVFLTELSREQRRSGLTFGRRRDD